LSDTWDELILNSVGGFIIIFAIMETESFIPAMMVIVSFIAFLVILIWSYKKGKNQNANKFVYIIPLIILLITIITGIIMNIIFYYTNPK